MLPTTLLVDASSSMRFPRTTHAKWEQARLVALGLAAVARAGGDPVGLVVSGDAGPHFLAPRSRRDVLGEVARTLGSVTPAGAAPLAPLVRRVRARSRLAIVSDFLGDADDIRRAAGEMVAAGGEVCAIHIVAHEELDPPRRAILATDPENETIARPLVADVVPAYTASFAAWRAALAASWRGEGLTYALVSTSESPARVVRRVIASAEVGQR